MGRLLIGDVNFALSYLPEVTGAWASPKSSHLSAHGAGEVQGKGNLDISGWPVSPSHLRSQGPSSESSPKPPPTQLTPFPSPLSLSSSVWIYTNLQSPGRTLAGPLTLIFRVLSLWEFPVPSSSCWGTAVNPHSGAQGRVLHTAAAQCSWKGS